MSLRSRNWFARLVARGALTSGLCLSGLSLSGLCLSTLAFAQPAPEATGDAPAAKSEAKPGEKPTEPAKAPQEEKPEEPQSPPPEKPDLEEDGADEAEDVTPEPKETTPPAAASTKEKAPPTETMTEKPPAKEKVATKKVAAQKPHPPKIDYSKLPITYHQWRIDLGIAYQRSWYRDGAYDLFSSDNGKSTYRPHAAVTFWSNGPMSAAAVLQYDRFEVSGEARSLPTLLSFDRIQVGAEARYHAHARIYGYGRLVMGPTFVRSRLGEDGDAGALELKKSGFSAALTAGSAVRVAGSRDGRERAFRVHLFFEGGFSFGSATKLHYEIPEGGALRAEGVDLGSLSLSGPVIALGGMVSY